MQEADIERDPFNRQHQERTARFKQEVVMILNVLRQQHKVILDCYKVHGTYHHHQRGQHDQLDTYDMAYRARNDFDMPPKTMQVGLAVAAAGLATRKGYAAEREPKAPKQQLSATDPSGYRDLLIWDCLHHIERRIMDFEEMNSLVKDLEILVSYHKALITLSTLSVFRLTHQTESAENRYQP